MKQLAQFSRFLVGIIFVFSGFVKVVDPVGTGIKLEEYFEVFAQDIPALKEFFMFFAHHSLGLSLVFCALELILGIALLVAYRMRTTAWVLLGTIIFFTFLTFYSAYFNKVTDCGCFGDFLKLKPWTSFSKDLVLLFFILVIVGYRKHYKPIKSAALAVGLATIISFGIGIYAIYFLPPIDFLPYAVGKSIPEQMKPTGIKPLMEYTFYNKKTGENLETQTYMMDTTTYKYKSVLTLNEDKIKPKITDYSVTNPKGDMATDSTFMGKKLLIIYKSADTQGMAAIKSLVTSAATTGVQAMVLTSMNLSDYGKFKADQQLNTPYYMVDATVLKTMARTNPCVILLDNGVVQAKWGSHSIPTKL